MECFAHAGAPAIGICKSCGKGTCRECARDLGFAVVCSESCVTRAAELESMSTKIKQINPVDAIKRIRTFGIIMLTLIGTLFLVIGLYYSINSEHVDILPIGLGSAFLLLSVIMYKQYRTV
jgi:hypothetical protein